jgi:signal transduction histidine kinase
MRCLFVALLFFTAFCRAQEEVPWIKAIDLRSLTPDEADEGRAYRFRGTFIFHDKNNAVFLQDETAGALFWHKGKTDFRPGDIVEVTGNTRSGLYVPGLEKVAFKVVGHGPMPQPIDATYDDLISGRYHYQWVTVEGIVRSIRIDDPNRPTIRLAMGSRIVEIHLDDYDGSDLIDHEIRVTGLAAGGINDRHQLIQPYVWPRSAEDLQVVTEPPPVEELPAVSAGNLLTFRPTARTGHRVKMSGTVLGSFPDGRVFVRDGKSALAVKLSQPEVLEPGLRIELLGFPEMESFSASLADATITSRETGTTPDAIPTGTESISSGFLNHELVSFTGTVADSFRTETGASLLLMTDGPTIRITTPYLENLPPPETRVRITGICDVESTRAVHYLSRPENISIHVRSETDLAIVSTPPWWTTGRLTAALFALSGICLLAILWIIMLRRQVEKQTHALRGRIENEAMHMERQRIAREFHDTLEQDLTGLSLQLGAASARVAADPARGLLDTARHLVSRIQSETRTLLHDLRTPDSETLDLQGALGALAAKHPGNVGPRVELAVAPDPPPLPPSVVHHLRMIAAESVTNAIKHAKASRIFISVDHTAEKMTLSVTDNGIGFDVKSETHEKPGHFGCMGIRERSRKLGADVGWTSQPGQGTTLQVTLPLPTQ